MKVFEQINRLKEIYRKIESESTGSPDIFASHLSISKRQLFNILDEIKTTNSSYFLRCNFISPVPVENLMP